MEEGVTSLTDACTQLNSFFSDLNQMMELINSQLTSKLDYKKHELYTHHPRGHFYISDYLSLVFLQNQSEKGTFQVLTRVHDGKLGSEWGSINPFTKNKAELLLIITDMKQDDWKKNDFKYIGEEILSNDSNLRNIESVEDFFRGHLLWDKTRINFVMKVEDLVSFSGGNIDSSIATNIIEIIPKMKIYLSNYQLSNN
jgi:hypothetical protein